MLWQVTGSVLVGLLVNASYKISYFSDCKICEKLDLNIYQHLYPYLLYNLQVCILYIIYCICDLHNLQVCILYIYCICDLRNLQV